MIVSVMKTGTNQLHGSGEDRYLNNNSASEVFRPTGAAAVLVSRSDWHVGRAGDHSEDI